MTHTHCLIENISLLIALCRACAPRSLGNPYIDVEEESI